MGVVEEEEDPLGFGRVKVRCFGYHSPDRAFLPTSELPWTQTVFPVTAGAAAAEIGSSPSLQKNSIVFGAFYDGDNLQDAIILGTIPGGVLQAANYTPTDDYGFGSALLAGGSGIPESGGYGEQSIDASSNGVTVARRANADPNSYLPPVSSAVSSAAAEGIASAAEKEATKGIVEISGTNKGPGIQKYWTATSAGTGAYGEPWCAAFACWAVREGSGLPEERLPTSAGSDQWIDVWAKRNSDIVEVKLAAPNATSLKRGDIIIKRSVGSGKSRIPGHTSIVTKGTDSAGNFETVDGNSGNAVRKVSRRKRDFNKRHYILSIKDTGIPANSGEEPKTYYGPNGETIREGYGTLEEKQQQARDFSIRNAGRSGGGTGPTQQQVDSLSDTKVRGVSQYDPSDNSGGSAALFPYTARELGLFNEEDD